MGKVGKKKRSDARKEVKKARKRANYLRFGPKQDHVGKRQKKKSLRQFKIRKSSGPVILSMPKAKTKAKRRRASVARKPGVPKFPLRPLRKRRQWGSAYSERENRE